MMTGAWLSSVAGGAWPWLASAAARGGTLAIVDASLASGASFTQYAARMKLPVFGTGDDIGALWYTTLAPLLTRTPGRRVASLIGLTRASDYFVLSELAIRPGHLIEHCHEQRSGPAMQQAHVAFAFTPCVARRL